LRDLPEGHLNADTLFIMTTTGRAEAVRALIYIKPLAESILAAIRSGSGNDDLRKLEHLFDTALT
jgi:hypothetical protein